MILDDESETTIQSFSVSSEHDESYSYHSCLSDFFLFLFFFLHISDFSQYMPAQEDESSDSDQEEWSDVETSVLLGVPDGPIDVEADVFDAAVSRIGGLPVRASSYV